MGDLAESRGTDMSEPRAEDAIVIRRDENGDWPQWAVDVLVDFALDSGTAARSALDQLFALGFHQDEGDER